MEPVYHLLVWIFRAFAAFGGHKVTRVGSTRLPEVGGGVIAINHTSYLDFTYAAIEILMKQCRVIPVDRGAGRESYEEAIRVLHTGELVAIGIGEAIPPVGTPDELTAELKTAMEKLLHEVQDAYGPHPVGEFWVPKRLGGGAMSLEDAEAIDR